MTETPSVKVRAVSRLHVHELADAELVPELRRVRALLASDDAVAEACSWGYPLEERERQLVTRLMYGPTFQTTRPQNHETTRPTSDAPAAQKKEGGR